MSTIECSCKLWPTPGIYVVTSTPLVSRTRATLRSAEFGFFGVKVYTRVQTPRRCGAPRRAGVLVFVSLVWRPLRTSWAIVGTRYLIKLDLRTCCWTRAHQKRLTVQLHDARTRRGA